MSDWWHIPFVIGMPGVPILALIWWNWRQRERKRKTPSDPDS